MGYGQNGAQVSEENNKGTMDKIKVGQSYSAPFRMPCASLFSLSLITTEFQARKTIKVEINYVSQVESPTFSHRGRHVTTDCIKTLDLPASQEWLDKACICETSRRHMRGSREWRRK